MIKVSVFYASGEGKHFDMAYYCEKHMTMVQRLCGPALKSVAVEQEVSGMVPGSPAPFLAMGHLYFETVDTFQAAFGQHLNDIIGDVPNYTNIEPRIQISEVKM